jgi:hypothetical protein
MTILRRLVLALSAALVLGQGAVWGDTVHPARGPQAMVRSLYQLVMTRKPVGISATPRFLTTYGPYLSRSLVEKIRVDRRCEQDWMRRFSNDMTKPPFEWLELDLFTGTTDSGELSSYWIVSAEPRADGSTRVLVRFKEPRWQFAASSTWDALLRVLKENGRFVVADIDFPASDATGPAMKLTAVLWSGCRGPRWVGP